MKAKTFFVASLVALSLGLTACGGNKTETTDMDTNATGTTIAPSTGAMDTNTTGIGTTTPGAMDTSASIGTGTTGMDTNSVMSDTAKP